MIEKLTTVVLCSLAVLCCDTAVCADGLVISEFLAINNSILADEDGEYTDWIEIYNGSTNTVNLDGWFLTDDAGELDKWRIPNISLSTGEYLVVFASDKDRDDPAGELHTDFRLSGGGEYLALIEPDYTTVHHAYSPEYPGQVQDVSFGVSTNELGDLRYFAIPTPGAQNGGDYLGLVEDTKFSVDRGIYSNAFTVAITSETAGATIHYTTDFTEPDEISGTVYTGPVTVSNTTIIRAIAFFPGWRSTDVDTHTYIFPLDVLAQDGSGYPSDTWGHAGADYEMDPEIVTSGLYSNQMVSSLMALPSMSLALPVDNMFGGGGVGIYPSGENIPRATSAELIAPTGETTEFQINCSVEIVGGSSVNRWKTDNISMRLRFKSPWGPSKLKSKMFGPGNADEFDTLILDARLNNVWHYGPNNEQRQRAQYVRDQYPADLQNQMGGFAHHCIYVHLYVCGLYWGIHALHERPDESFAAAYLGGEKDDYHVLKHRTSTVVHGDNSDYNAMIGLASSGLATEEKYQQIQEYLDIPDFINYMLVNFYVGNTDWAHQNWYASRNVIDPDGRWRYHSWDPEHCMEGINQDVTGKDDAGGPTGLHQDLSANAEYSLLFADHVHRHLFNDGLLTATNAQAAYLRLLDQVDLAVIAESARWGDNRREPPYTRDNEWLAERTRLLSEFFPTRTGTLLAQLKARDLYPGVDAPVFADHGGLFTNGYDLGMSAANTIYYTLDGTDPREYGTGAAVGTVYSGEVPLTLTSLVKARAYSGTEWSALNEAVFVLAETSPLRVTEVMYNPRDPVGTETNAATDADEFEFVELKNTGGGTLGLAGIRFTNGISFDFTYSDVLTLAQDEYVVVVKDIDAFTNRYGSSMLIAGEYSGSLDNSGERLSLCDGTDNLLLSFSYNDGRGWPLAADGAGHSLVATELANQEDGSLDYGGNWRASAYIDGSPGEADPDPIEDILFNEIAAHTDYTNAAKPEYDSNDWLEIYNTKTSGVSLANWYLSDSASNLKKWAIPSTNTITAGGWKAFDEVNGFHSPITSGFGLDKAGEQVFISYLPGTAEDRVADAISFKGQENGPTLGRYADGSAYWQTTVPTRGTTNALASGHVVINQLMYHPSPTAANPEDNVNDEYIVLYNPTDVSVDLWNDTGTWRIDGGVEYSFPSNTSIGAKDYLTLVSFDPTNTTAMNAFEEAYDLTNVVVYIMGPYKGRLSNNGERIALERPQAPDAEGEGVSWVIVDEVIYSAHAPWPDVQTNGMGLQRAYVEQSGNDPSNWVGLPASLTAAKVFITSPAAGSTLYVPFSTTITTVIDDNQVSGSVHSVEFFLGTNSIAVDSTEPYEAILDHTHVSTAGLYRLRADLLDDGGSESSVDIVFHAAMAERIEITHPLSGTNYLSPFSDAMVAAVDLSHVVGSVHHVRFYSGAELLHEDTNSPYSCDINQFNLPPTSNHQLLAVLEDDFGITTSASVNVFTYASIYGDWDYRMQVSVSGHAISQGLEDFPVLIKLHEGLEGFDYDQVASASGGDLRVADVTGTNILYHEIESWDPGGTSYVWVQMPELPEEGTSIWLYWGNGSAMDPPDYATNGSVWANGFNLVQHMADETGSTTVSDSTSNDVQSTFRSSYSWEESGQIGRALGLPAIGSAVQVADPYVPLAESWTISTWFKGLYPTSQGRTLARTFSGDRAAIVKKTSDDLGVQTGLDFTDSGYDLPAGNTQWHHIAAVGEGGGTDFYVDGHLVGSASNQVSGSIQYIANTFSLFGGECFAEYIDEFRIDSVARSSNWIWTCWMNQGSNDLFNTYGSSEENNPLVEVPLDVDGDGMMDLWEIEHFGSTNAPEGIATNDPDKDGLNNDDEFTAGTNPTNSNSVFWVDVNLSNGAALVEFFGVDASGYGGGYQRYYSLENATNLEGGWSGVPDYTNLPGEDRMIVYSNSPGGFGPLYFRGQVWLVE